MSQPGRKWQGGALRKRLWQHGTQCLHRQAAVTGQHTVAFAGPPHLSCVHCCHVSLTLRQFTVAEASCRTRTGTLLPQCCRMWRRISCGSALPFQHLMNGCPQAVVGHEGAAEQRLVGQGGARRRQAAGGSRGARLVIDPACGRAGPGECKSISRRVQHTSGQGEGLRTGRGHRGESTGGRQQGQGTWSAR